MAVVLLLFIFTFGIRHAACTMKVRTHQNARRQKAGDGAMFACIWGHYDRKSSKKIAEKYVIHLAYEKNTAFRQHAAIRKMLMKIYDQRVHLCIFNRPINYAR